MTNGGFHQRQKVVLICASESARDIEIDWLGHVPIDFNQDLMSIEKLMALDLLANQPKYEPWALEKVKIHGEEDVGFENLGCMQQLAISR